MDSVAITLIRRRFAPLLKNWAGAATRGRLVPTHREQTPGQAVDKPSSHLFCNEFPPLPKNQAAKQAVSRSRCHAPAAPHRPPLFPNGREQHAGQAVDSAASALIQQDFHALHENRAATFPRQSAAPATRRTRQTPQALQAAAYRLRPIFPNGREQRAGQAVDRSLRALIPRDFPALHKNCAAAVQGRPAASTALRARQTPRLLQAAARHPQPLVPSGREQRTEQAVDKPRSPLIQLDFVALLKNWAEAPRRS